MTAWDLSCPDWEQRLREGRSLVPDLPLFHGEGERAVEIFNMLQLSDVPGTPAMKDAAGDWFRGIVRALFGSLNPVTRERMIRELFLLVPKKNSKTTNGALLMLVALLMNQRPSAPFIMTAPVQDVADIAFAAAAGAIGLDPVLSKKLHVREHKKTIVHRETKATLEIMTFDPAVLTGQKCAGVLIDELHVVAKMAKAASAIRQLRGGTLPFPEAFMAFITTQSEEAPAGVFRAELMKARAIRDGRQEGAMLPVLYEFPASMQRDKAAPWKDPALWHLVTPNVGRSITIPRLAQEMRTAEATSEAELRAWASQHLNIEIGLALHSDSWAGAAYWESAEVEGLASLDELIERSEVAAVGIDGGGLDDLLGLAVIGRERETGRWLIWGKGWAHKIVLERRKEIAPQLLDFQAQGELVIVEKPGQDTAELAELVLKVYEAGLLDREQDEATGDRGKSIGVDPAGIAGVVRALEEREIPADLIIGIPQGWKMTGAVKEFERKLAGGEAVHGGGKLLAWCVGNARLEPRGNAIVITKQASGSAKIDLLLAVIDAVHLIAMAPDVDDSVPDIQAITL